jgi:hypothetical protein
MVCQPGRNGKALAKEVLSMRLGKEQAVGYVEDTEHTADTEYIADSRVDSAQARELALGEPDGMPLTPAPEPSITVS